MDFWEGDAILPLIEWEGLDGAALLSYVRFHLTHQSDGKDSGAMQNEICSFPQLGRDAGSANSNKESLCGRDRSNPTNRMAGAYAWHLGRMGLQNKRKTGWNMGNIAVRTRFSFLLSEEKQRKHATYPPWTLRVDEPAIFDMVMSVCQPAVVDGSERCTTIEASQEIMQ